MSKETRTFVITFLFASVAAAMVAAKFLMAKPPEPTPVPVPVPVAAPIEAIEEPVAPVAWSQVNKEDADRAYWDADRKKREAQIAADLAARQKMAAGIRVEQSAREAQQARETRALIERQEEENRRNWRPTVHRP